MTGMLEFICMEFADQGAAGSKHKIQIYASAGNRPATPCLPSCRSNYSAIGTDNDM